MRCPEFCIAEVSASGNHRTDLCVECGYPLDGSGDDNEGPIIDTTATETPSDDECVIDTCRFVRGDAADDTLERGYIVQCVSTWSDHVCTTEPRILCMDADVAGSNP